MLCFRLFSENNPAAPLVDAVAMLREGQAPKDLYAVEPASFQQIPNAPFAYWVSERIRRLFVELPAFEGDGRTVKQGLATADDFRFVRTTWEAPQANEVTTSLWFPFAKGGSYSPFYSDIHLVVNWRKEGAEVKNNLNEKGGIRSNVWMLGDTSVNCFLKPGVTWPLRTTSEISMRAMPRNCLFGHKGPVVFVEQGDVELIQLLGIGRSSTFRTLLSLQLAAADAAARSYEVGILQKLVLPSDSSARMVKPVRRAWRSRRSSDTTTSTSHAFTAPAMAPIRSLKKPARP